MPKQVPIDDDGSGSSSLLATLRPTIQNISWNRADAPPALSDITLTSADATFVSVDVQYVGSSVQWLNLNNFPDGQSTPFSGADSAHLALQNLDQLTGTGYKAIIYFTFQNGGETVQRSATINLSISGAAQNSLRTDAAQYNAVFHRTDGSFSGATVNVLNNSDNSTLTFESVGDYFLGKSFTTQFTIEQNNIAGKTDLPNSGTVPVTCRIRKSGTIVYVFTVNLALIADQDVLADLSQNSFFLRKGFNETQTAILDITNPLGKQFTVEGPDWLQFSQKSGNSSVAIAVTTVNSDSLSVGNRSGFLTVTSGGKSVKLAVSLQVTAFALLPSKKEYFCLDGDFLQIGRLNDNARFVKITLGIFFSTASESERVTAEYQLPYFNALALFSIGEKVQNLFPVFEDCLFGITQEQLIYNAAAVDVTIQELDPDYKVLFSQELKNLLFFPGKRPALFPLLSDFATRSVLPGAVFIQTKILNNTAVATTSDDADQAIETVDLPPQENVYQVQFLNVNLAPEWANFSGDFKIEDSYEHVYDDFQQRAKKYGCRISGTITVSSGFLLQEEADLLRSIIASELVYIRRDEKIYRCFSTMAKMTRADNNENMQERSLEFLIIE